MHHSKDKQVGLLIRRLRSNRGLTLQDAASRLLTSAAVLSRKERGEQVVDRQDIQLIITAYQLEPAAIHALWSSAGLLPDSVSTAALTRAQAEATALLLGRMTFPAQVVGYGGFVVAWNYAAEYLWQQALPLSREHHLFDLFFAPKVVQWMDPHWSATITHIVEIFYLRTRHFAADATFQSLIARLKTRFGAPFADRWDRLDNHEPVEPIQANIASLSIHYAGAPEPVHYTVLDTNVVELVGLEVIMYVPTDATRHIRYVRPQTGSRRSEVIFADRFDLRDRGKPGARVLQPVVGLNHHSP